MCWLAVESGPLWVVAFRFQFLASIPQHIAFGEVLKYVELTFILMNMV